MFFEQFYKDGPSLARHLDAPLRRERDDYLAHLAAEGLSRSTLLICAGRLLYLARHLNLSDSAFATDKEVVTVVTSWASQKEGGLSIDAKTERRFVTFSLRWLRHCGRLQESVKTTPFATLVDAFAAYMTQERALSEWTIRARCARVREFLTWFGERDRPFDQISVHDVDTFIEMNAPQRWSRRSVAMPVDALRAFFRFAEVRGNCQRGIAACIDRPRIYSQELLPVGPSWDDVRKLIESINGATPQDIRDRAILLLFANYAFRNGEVASLRLEDLDWERETIAVHRRKQRRHQAYPLTRQVGEAVLRYLRHARPQCSCREIFVPLIPPYRALTIGGMHALVRRRMQEAGIKPVHCPSLGGLKPSPLGDGF